MYGDNNKFRIMLILEEARRWVGRDEGEDTGDFVSALFCSLNNN